MKKIIFISLLFISYTCLFAQPINNIEKLPTCESVYFLKNSNSKTISFYSVEENIQLYQIINVDIWKCLKNEDNNIFLVKEKGESYKIGNTFYNHDKLFLLDFLNGKKIFIENDIFVYSLSSDGTTIMYIKNQDIITNKEIIFYVWSDNSLIENRINVEQLVNMDIFYSIQIVYYKGFFEIRFFEDNINFKRIQIDNIGTLINVLNVQYENGTFFYMYSENEKEFLN